MKKIVSLLTAFLIFIGLTLQPAHADFFFRPGASSVTLSNITGGPLPSTKGGVGQANVINVLDIPGVTVDDSSNDDAVAINAYLDTHKSNIKYYFPKGVYHTSTAINEDGLSNVTFEGEPGADLTKKAGFSEEYILYTRSSNDVTVRGLIFHGLTTATNVNNFGEQGIYFASSNRMKVEHCQFYNIGDAAIRSTTTPGGVEHLNAFNTTIINNYFYNVSQVTTTPGGDMIVDGAGWGGTQGYIVENNIFDNLKGSVKVACRYPTSGAIIRGNFINNATSVATSTGIEILSYTDVLVTGNSVSGSQSWGLNAYTNPDPDLNKFDWGGYVIAVNQFRNVARGIRISNAAYGGDSLYSDTTGIMVNNNLLKNVTWATGVTGIIFVNGTIRGSSAIGNIMTDIASGQYMTIPGTGVDSANNTQN